MLLIKKTCLCLVGFIVLSSCEETNNSLLITSTTQLTFGPDGGSQSFTVESNTDWSIISYVDWIAVSPSSGNTNQMVTVTVAIGDNRLEEETKLVLRTGDGEKVLNINVIVEGSYIKTGKQIEIWNNRSNLFFGGSAGWVDSIEISSNTSWEIKGPEWIEVWDGERWRPLSQNRGVVNGEGTDWVYLRTAGANNEEDGMEDLLYVSERYTGNYTKTINVTQLGRLEAHSAVVGRLADGVAFQWICGCDVSKIYFRITDDSKDIPDDNQIRQTFDFTYPDYINSVDNMEINSTKVMDFICEDKDGNMGDYYYSNTISSDKGQDKALTLIVDVIREDWNKWKVYTRPDNETKFFYEYVSNIPDGAFAYNTPILYYLLTNNLLYSCKKFITSGYYEWSFQERTNEIHVLTWSNDIYGKKSDFISRYDRYYDPDGNELPAKPLLDRIPKSLLYNSSLR